MKIDNLKLLAVSAVAALAFAGTAHAQVAGGTSDSSYNQVGVSSAFGPSHPTAGKAGLSAAATGLTNFVAFQDLQADGTTSGGVTTINNPITGPNDHQNLGLFHFAQVANNDVWFGEWTSTATSGSTDRTVYYAGTTTGTTIPASGTATYSVNGISDYATNGLLSGTFNANFTSKTLTGSLASAGYSVNIGTASINSLTGAFNGSGASNSAGSTGGAVSGRFYGANAATLAGIVTFASRQYNTAFGGTKN